ncbi:hypothetical protein EV643_105330 [Kribbella sp. VKM Ac-2527]|uniref:Uncharacterized protein n=1 Tax=Kribbella caucasensis TaxID=2512215 RepID=A0A4R6KHB7_9ACTN|nr:hypothetical protein EV643_105330 [Kribbella sp. VKM Ac-2527]
MRRVLALTAVVLAAVMLVAAPVQAAAPEMVNGGGRGTVDGVTPFSQFGFQVSRHADGSVTGHFNCLMAGASEFPGFDLMAVRGRVTDATFAGDEVTFEGTGMFQTGNQGKSPATFLVVVTEGGPGEGTLQLTLLTPFEFVLPTESVLNGRIDVH